MAPSFIEFAGLCYLFLLIGDVFRHSPLLVVKLLGWCIFVAAHIGLAAKHLHV